jgi:type III secretory pathway component EscT
MGTISLLVFVATGAYMRFFRTGEFSEAVHLLYRSRHIYILGAALANLALANVTLQQRVLDRIISAAALVAPPLLLTAFIFEPSTGPDTGRGWAVWGQYALFLAAALLLIRAWRAR